MSGYRVREVALAMILTFSALAHVVTGAPQKTHQSWQNVFEWTTDLKPDRGMVAQVQGLVIRRDVGLFTLVEGTICLATPLDGRRRAVMFTGKGRFEMTPPTAIEKQQLARYYNSDSIALEFSVAYFIFADSTADELSRQVKFAAGEFSAGAVNHVNDLTSYLRAGEDNKELSAYLMRGLLSSDPSGLFFAGFNPRSLPKTFFEISPFAEEEVSLYKSQALLVGHYRDLVCQFHLARDYAAGKDLAHESAEDYEFSGYKMDITIDDDLHFRSECSATIVLKRSGVQWTFASLSPELRIDSAFWEDGSRAIYSQGERHGLFWFVPDTNAALNSPFVLKLFYHGDVIVRESPWIYLTSSTGWYPNDDASNNATFDLTYHTPKQLQFVSVGELISQDTIGREITSHWVSDGKIKRASFNIGFFKEDVVTMPSLPPVRLSVSTEGHQELGAALAEEGVGSERDPLKAMTADVINSLNFFQRLYGPCPAKSLSASEISYVYENEAFPGMIHLSLLSTQLLSSSGELEKLRAHEVAHQWWGIGVNFATYHDQWLSEAFAEYSGLWFTQATLGRNDEFFKALKDWRDEIFENRKYTFGDGKESGPIWLGYRTSGSETEGDYQLIIYEKGAWALHMLRNFFLDLETMKEDAFVDLLRDFYQTYKGQRATTEDFRQKVEEHADLDMGWFFDQWIYGIDQPTYYFSYKVTEDQPNSFVTHCRVRQEDVPDDFKMFVPVKIEMGDAKPMRFRTFITGREANFDLPAVASRPSKVVFNDLESVLCRVKTEDWKSK